MVIIELGDIMYLFYLSIYSFIIWFLFFVIDYFFLPIQFAYELQGIQFLIFIVIGWIISYLFTQLLNALKWNRYILSGLSACLILFLQWVTGFFVLDFFSAFTFLLTNFLYSFTILSSLNQKSLV